MSDQHLSIWETELPLEVILHHREGKSQQLSISAAPPGFLDLPRGRLPIL